MVRREAIKNATAEQGLFGRRAIFAALVIALLALVLMGRMAHLQILDHAHFITLSHDNRVRLVAVPPPRGLLFDRKGALLADNVPSYRLEITPVQTPDLEDTLARLGDVIEIDETHLRRFRETRARRQTFEAIPLRFNLDNAELARFAVNRHRFPGVEINAHLARHYPREGSAVHALGYVGRVDRRDLQRVDPVNYSATSHIGKLGVEKYYESLLHGQVGSRKIEINAQGRTLRILEEQPPVPGADLMLTLDTGLQAAAEQALGSFNGAVVAMDPRTGEILALASQPVYDPNLFVNGISSENYAALRQDPERPLFNRALTGQYPPGSTIKPFVALAGLEHGETSAERTIQAGPYYQLPNNKKVRYRDWKRGGHGKTDLHKAIVQSVDVYFYDLAHRLDIDPLHEFLRRFGLGRKTGLDTTGENQGLVPSREWKRRVHGEVWFPGETVIAGIGQGYMLATPLQLASAASTLAMRGKRVRPRLLYAVRNADDPSFKKVQPRVDEALSLSRHRYWDAVIEAMVDVAHKPNGTAWSIGQDAPYTIAGKTGTAQVFGLEEDEEYEEEEIAFKLRDHALFIGFAPAEDPRIAVAVIVENGGSGGRVAAPVARQVMDHFLFAANDGEEAS